MLKLCAAMNCRIKEQCERYSANQEKKAVLTGKPLPTSGVSITDYSPKKRGQACEAFVPIKSWSAKAVPERGLA